MQPCYHSSRLLQKIGAFERRNIPRKAPCNTFIDGTAVRKLSPDHISGTCPYLVHHQIISLVLVPTSYMYHLLMVPVEENSEDGMRVAAINTCKHSACNVSCSALSGSLPAPDVVKHNRALAYLCIPLTIACCFCCRAAPTKMHRIRTIGHTFLTYSYEVIVRVLGVVSFLLLVTRILVI